MTVLVDTSILIDRLRGNPRAQQVLADAFGEEGRRVAASVLTKVEVLAGMRAGEEEATNMLLAQLTWIPVDESMAERAGELARLYLRSHPGVDSVDFLIAATVEALDAELRTRNLKHFPMVARKRDPCAF